MSRMHGSASPRPNTREKPAGGKKVPGAVGESSPSTAVGELHSQHPHDEHAHMKGKRMGRY